MVNQNQKKSVTFGDVEYESYAEAASALDKSVSAISKYVKRHGSLDLKDGPTKELLTSGKLGQVYYSTKEAKQSIGIKVSWAVFRKRVMQGVPVECAKDDDSFKQYKIDLKEYNIHTFKDPIYIAGEVYHTYRELKNKFEPEYGKIALPQTIRRRQAKNIKGIDLILDKTHASRKR